MGEPTHSFENNVFINCPFDNEYLPLLRPLLFTIIYLGKIPRIALERSDSGENRIDKICELIADSQFGIHDLSRLKSIHSEEFFRLNMPFELGIDYGARVFGSGLKKQKKHLILEKSPYDYKIALSDLSGVDIKTHKEEPKEIVRAVRDWFYETVDSTNADYTTKIWYQFAEFSKSLFNDRKVEGLTDKQVAEEINKMPISEYLDCVRVWISENKTI